MPYFASGGELLSKKISRVNAPQYHNTFPASYSSFTRIPTRVMSSNWGVSPRHARRAWSRDVYAVGKGVNHVAAFDMLAQGLEMLFRLEVPLLLMSMLYNLYSVI